MGRERFLAETGIRESDWLGRYWVRWSEAVLEAGYEPNTPNQGRTDEEMLERLSAFVRELQRSSPVSAGIRTSSKSALELR